MCVMNASGLGLVNTAWYVMQQSLLDMTAFNDITTTSAQHNCMIHWTITQTRIVHACWPASYCTVHLYVLHASCPPVSRIMLISGKYFLQ